MSKKNILQSISETGIVSIIRMEDESKVVDTAMAIASGGVNALEITVNTPGVYNHIKSLSEGLKINIGAGSIMEVDEVNKAYDCGANFIVTPISKKEVIQRCAELDIPIFSGAFSTSEIMQAHEWGADVIKIFPSEIVGPDYIQNIKSQFPFLKILPTGGITLENIDEWLDAGSDYVGIGSLFVSKAYINDGAFEKITATVKEIVDYTKKIPDHH